MAKMPDKKTVFMWFHLVVGCVILVLSGMAYRYTADKLHVLSESPVLPKVPFARFPYAVDQWRGTDLPLSETVLKVANNDDYVSRLYRNEQDNGEVTFYLAFTSKPVNMDGHRPTVCYTGSGWLHEETQEIDVNPVSGAKFKALLHRFRKPMSSFPAVYVLNYYFVSGQITTDHKAFSGLKYRKIVQSGQNARYVAQVQISSTSWGAVTDFAGRIAPLLWLYMPQSHAAQPAVSSSQD